MNIRRESFSILAVCDGNVCRSAAAQFTLAERLPGVRVESAGRRARTGSPVCDLVAGELAGEAGEVERFWRDFRSRRSQDVDVAAFDLVLTATTDIRSDLVRSFPALRDRFFTLREAAGALEAVLGDELAVAAPLDPFSLVPVLNRYRGASPTGPELPPRLRKRTLDPQDIPDAHGDRPRLHRAVVELTIGTAAAVGDSLAKLAV